MISSSLKIPNRIKVHASTSCCSLVSKSMSSVIKTSFGDKESFSEKKQRRLDPRRIGQEKLREGMNSHDHVDEFMKRGVNLSTNFGENEENYLSDVLGITNNKIKSKRQNSFQNRKDKFSPLNYRKRRVAETKVGPFPTMSTWQLHRRDQGTLADDNDHDYVRARIRVKSTYAARTIDIASVLLKVFQKKTMFGATTPDTSVSSSAPLRHRFGRSSVIIQLPPIFKLSPPIVPSTVPRAVAENLEKIEMTSDLPTSIEEKNQKRRKNRVLAFQESDSSRGIDAKPAENVDLIRADDDRLRYVVVFRFGSVVFFNVSPREAQNILQKIKKYSVDPIPTGFENKEHFEVAVCPGVDDPQVGGDFATVKQLDMNNVAVISTIMAQTVAMDSYDVMVDKLMTTFANVNSSVKKQGKLSEQDRETLFRVIAQNNSIFIDMVSKLGVLDRSDTAWNFSQYDSVFEGMKTEFEINDRFENIEFKLNLIQQNAKLFLEILQDQKSNSLEWIIIVLIAFECVLMCLEMSGLGESFFSSIIDIQPPK